MKTYDKDEVARYDAAVDKVAYQHQHTWQIFGLIERYGLQLPSFGATPEGWYTFNWSFVTSSTKVSIVLMGCEVDWFAKYYDSSGKFCILGAEELPTEIPQTLIDLLIKEFGGYARVE